MYLHKGVSYKQPIYSGGPSQVYTTGSKKRSNVLHYLAAPVLPSYNFKNKLQISVGPQFSYLLSLRTDFGYYRKFDLSMIGSIEYKPFKSFGIYGGYDYGLTKFLKSVVVSNGEVTGYTYIGKNRTPFLGVFYQGEVLTKR
jgi:hypothetical protein